MGIYARGRRLWIRFKGPDGRWTNKRTEFMVGQEVQAAKVLGLVVDRIRAGVEVVGERREALTVREYAELRWFPIRRGLVSDWRTDEGWLKNHVFPTIGEARLEEVRARHLAELFRKLRVSKVLAPKSIYNVYGVVSALFRDAQIDGLIDANPCVLSKHVLGANVDADPEWRRTAIFKRDELAALVWDDRLPKDRRISYALQGLAMLRHGEAAGLRWRHVDPSTEPLGQLVIATSYDKGRTKTKTARYMPIVPALAALLAEWKLSGWAEMMDRAPELDDLVVPCPKPTNRGPRVRWGAMRSDHYSYKRLVRDLATLGFRHRRGHDLRRTGISLARSDGADKDILRRGTHKAPKEVIEGYTTFEWDVLCREVAKYRLDRPELAEVIPLAAGALVTSLVTASANHSEDGENQLGGGGNRRRVSIDQAHIGESRSAPVSLSESTESATSGEEALSGEEPPLGVPCNGVTAARFGALLLEVA